MNPPPMMKCGHQANAKSGDKDVCAICLFKPESREVDTSPPDLSQRIAMCTYCGQKNKSTGEGSIWVNVLPFFEHKPSQPYDGYYCGCRGWD